MVSEHRLTQQMARKEHIVVGDMASKLMTLNQSAKTIISLSCQQGISHHKHTHTYKKSFILCKKYYHQYKKTWQMTLDAKAQVFWRENSPVSIPDLWDSKSYFICSVFISSYSHRFELITSSLKFYTNKLMSPVTKWQTMCFSWSVKSKIQSAKTKQNI